MRAGVDPVTGEWLEGWPHCVGCLNFLLTTRIGTMPWLRAYGTLTKDLQDQNAVNDVLIDFYGCIAEALDEYEPGFGLKSVELVQLGRDGVFVFDISGTFYPLGHLGDFSLTEEKNIQFNRSTILPGGIKVT